MPAFGGATENVGRSVADCPAYTVVGGGAPVAAVEVLGLGDRIREITSCGGRSLEMLEGNVLPGIAVFGMSEQGQSSCPRPARQPLRGYCRT